MSEEESMEDEFLPAEESIKDEPLSMKTSADLDRDRRETINEGIKSCLEILESQNHVLKWSEGKMKEVDKLSEDEQEKLEFLLSSSKRNIESLQSQIKQLREALALFEDTQSEQ
ncbi:hypothetical protein [Candidatus Similichlamydia epinepheli]|uniref:hypothetical protein n=1 Tax=Candidatus Similichlamydia epinepheli TaxID=1903953 RepID=UPI000D39DD9B|nr:hypothetical protein [Candidatus Similichlamydia epinepheli]